MADLRVARQQRLARGELGEDGRIVVSNVDTGTSWSRRGTTYHSRASIHEISEDGFKVEYETSTDGGETWFVGTKATYSRKAG